MRDLGENLKLRIPGAARSSSGGTDGESSPLLNLSTEAQQPPQSEVRESSSELSFSHEYHPFEQSKTGLMICLFHVILYLIVSVAAFGYGFEKWGIIDSVYFGVVTFTTIGFGDLAPSTDAGRFFMVFFALYGIGILGVFLSILGEAFLEAGHRAMAETEARAKKRVLAMFSSSDGDDEEPETKAYCREWCVTIVTELPIICLLLFLSIVLGIPEGKSIISSIYFAVITATTIGFGDLHPTESWMRAIYIFYLPFSVAVFGQILSKIAGVYMTRKAREADEKFLHRHLALRDLKAMDVDGDGKVSYGEFLSFIIVALDKVEKEEVDEIHLLFKSLDVDNNGYLEKSDLVKLSTGERSHTMQLT
jgi:voltage-gated potassium channel Kch